MSSSSPSTTGPFRIVEHQVPCQHIREYPGATANEQEDVLHLAVKQYIPLDNPDPQPGDVTILATHANGFPKELYEPLWEEIHARSRANGFRIRSIWMTDVAHQGQSSVLNEDLLGNDPSWFDHPRDLLHLVNVKHKEMPRPIVGIGHSMGGAHLAQLCLMHPRLIHSLVLLDPVIQRQTTQLDPLYLVKGQHVIAKTTQLSTYRRDLWPSRKAAADGFKKNPFYQTWDPRVLDRWIKYGLRDLPTGIYPLNESEAPKDGDRPVTLRTTLHQEVFTFSRPNYDGPPGKDVPINRVTHPDLDPTHMGSFPFYRPEPSRIFAQIQHLRPSVLYVFGGKSDMCHPDMMADKMQNTGAGLGGSGGAAAGRVRDVYLEKYGHLLAQEAPIECGEATSQWLGKELQRWRNEERFFREQWSKKSKVEKMTIDKRWKEHVPAPVRPKKESKAKL
ncbi:putative toxin biosynthesis protein [Aspergillus clavatus NRRL 1]|uniref:Toxin biosynthesis protein, putative n=1 Tax=Aspergillus clavatus (strain ATCC 1007 / CBS 513.65 / DSM 816 / NCTC 3887 / NRRL 1 / QM 1276 / 107) TaxID=344612 RepID=A1CIF4_ASPCL|nr:toxin biosynthesis protein, putative [Aspergillus clavatus NRRL 1]EAW10659.1 toxin biosynthesis protein, putative [Aspergillus clavatus NRRL 1]